MKTSLKSKLSKLLLGVTLGLGVAVGAAAGGGKASEVKADTTYEIAPTKSLTGASGTSYTSSAKTYIVNNVTFSVNNWIPFDENPQVKVNQGNTSSLSASNFVLYNTTALDNPLTSIVITFIGSVTQNYCQIHTGSSALSSNQTYDTNKKATSVSDSVFTWTYTESSDKFFRIGFAKNGGTVKVSSIVVTTAPAAVKINYNYNLGGATGTVPTGGTEKAGTQITLASAPTRNGFIFNGWNDGSKNYDASALYTLPQSGSVTFTAQWTAKTALTLVADNVNMKLGDSDKSVAVTAGGSEVSGYTLTSGKTSVISIVNNQLHVVGLGDATITITKAEDENNTYTSGTFNVHVDYADITSFELDFTEGTLGKGGEATLPGVTILPANANQAYSWGDAVATEGIIYTYNPSTHELAIDANNTVEGTIQFTATATGDSSKKATVVYTVQAAQIANITGVTASATGAIVAKQYVGDAFDPQGFSFVPTWSEGDHDVVVINANDISWNALVAGSNPTGTYSCADGEFTVTITGVTVVNDTIVSIAFDEECDMTNKSYYVGDSWDFSGLSIVGTMDSGTTAPAISSSNVTFSSDDVVATTTHSITVTATYQGLTATKVISGIVVNEVTMNSLTVNYTGGQPVLGTDFTFAGSITANMSNGTHPTVNLSDVTIGSVDKFTTNQQTITVTHKTTGAKGTFNVTYKTKGITYTTSWTRCTSTTDIVSGQTYILGYEATANSGTIVPMKNTNDSNYMNSGTSSGNTGTITMSSVTSTSDYEVQLISSTEVSGAYYIKCNGKYISNKNVKNSCTLETETAKTTSFGITVGNNDVFTFKIAENASYHTLSYNTSSPRFACYGGTMKNLVVYKKTQTASGTADIIKLNAALKSGKTFNEGGTISASDFDCSTLDNLNQTKTVTATSVSPTKLVAGENTITVNYNSWSTTVVVNAAEVAHLDHIEVVDGTGTRSFTRGTSFNSTGVKIKAYYSNTDKTKFPDRELTSGFTVTPLTSAQMNVANTYDVSVSYTENGVTKNTTYSVTVTPKVSTSVTIAGDGVEGSNGAYTLASGVTNEVELTLGCDGDETVEFVQGNQNVVTFANGKLGVNSSTKTNEQITVSFKASSAVATLTVNISAEEGIQLISNDEIDAYVGSSFSYDINIQLNNVESATWTLPQGDFVIESETEDNSGFVGTIYFTDEVSDTLTFSVLTGKGETLSVDIEVLAVNDDIKSISASLKSGVTYSAGKGQTFSNDDLNVTYVRDSGAKGTLDSDEFTVSGLPEGSFNRVASYKLTVTSTENTDATSVLTINVGMPSDLNLNFVTSKEVTEDGETYWKKVTDLSTINSSKKYVFIYEDGTNSKIFNNTDAGTSDDDLATPAGFIYTSVTNGTATYSEGTPYLTINYDSSKGYSIKCVGGSDNLKDKFIYGTSGSNGISSGATETFMKFEIAGDDKHIIATSNSTSFRFNKSSGNNRFRFFKTSTSGNSYVYPYLYELATKPGESHTEYTNVNKTTETKYDYAKLYNFITLANEKYNNICNGGTTAPDIKNWNLSNSPEYKALEKNELELKLLRTCICGNGQIGLDGVYVNGDKNASSMVVEFLQKYDYVVNKYGQSYNYLARTTTPVPGLVPVAAAPAMFKNMLSNLGLDVMFNEENAPTSWVLLVTIAVAGLATGGYFYIRKRKED